MTLTSALSKRGSRKPLATIGKGTLLPVLIIYHPWPFHRSMKWSWLQARKHRSRPPNRVRLLSNTAFDAVFRAGSLHHNPTDEQQHGPCLRIPSLTSALNSPPVAADERNIQANHAVVRLLTHLRGKLVGVRLHCIPAGHLILQPRRLRRDSF